MNIEKLKAFIVVAEELNFRKSAEILGMSQPPLTRLIASLEHELEAKLFERSTRSVKLTEAGVILLKEAREITSALERIETEVRAASKIKTKTLKIAFSRTAFMTRALEIVQEFQERFPKIKITLQEESSQEILKGLQNNLFDIGLTEAFSQIDEFKNFEINNRNMGVLLPIKHPLSKKKIIEFSDLKNETIILHHKNEAKEFFDKISHLISKLKARPKIYIKGPNESCPILVATGKGVSLTISDTQNIVPDLTRFVPIKDLFLPVQMFWKEERANSHLNTFISFIIENKTVAPKKTSCLPMTHALSLEEII